MQIDWQIAPKTEWHADTLIFAGFEKGDFPRARISDWMDDVVPWLQRTSAPQDFNGKHKQVVVAHGPGDAAIPRVILVGLGKEEKFSVDAWRESVVNSLRKCRDMKLDRAGIALENLRELPEDDRTLLEEGVTAAILGMYQYLEHKTRDIEDAKTEIQLALFSEQPPEAELLEAFSTAEANSAGVILARNLTAGPSNQVTPSHLLQTARTLADEFGFSLEAINFEKALAMGMGAFAAVARASREPAYCIILEHAPEGCREEQPIILVGKGITFDTGGISLKPSSKLDAMKNDMAGAAAVLGTFKAIGKLQIPRRVIGILPCTENMPGGKAYKPGDIIHSLSGLSIEVISTDAEGRMILCDALTHALTYKPAAVVDLATLTGACIIALGDRVAGAMGNRDEMVTAIGDLGRRVGEKFWPLPLYDFYFDEIKSDVADFKNAGDRKAGSIVGGVFLKQFVPDEIPWTHLDIAGTSWADRDLLVCPKGSTGFGVRTMLELIRNWDELGIR